MATRWPQRSRSVRPGQLFLSEVFCRRIEHLESRPSMIDSSALEEFGCPIPYRHPVLRVKIFLVVWVHCKPPVSPQLMSVAEPVAHAMSALHRIEASHGAAAA